jgi:hypothetical protein
MANDVVTDEPHRAPVEPGQARDLRPAPVREGLAQGGQRTDAGRVHPGGRRSGSQNQPGLERGERVAPQVLAALHALQQETLGAAPVERVKQPQGRDFVGRALHGDGHDGEPPRSSA